MPLIRWGGLEPVRRLLAAPLLLALGLATACGDDAASPSSIELATRSDSTSSRRAGDDRPSIVLVVVESLRTDAVGSYGPDRATPLPVAEGSATPRLDALAATGTRYAWAIAGSPESVASHASMFTGLRPDQHGAALWTSPGLAPDVETVAEVLAARGYETVGFSENPMAGPAFGLDRGFERFEAPDPVEIARQRLQWRRAAPGFDALPRVRSWLESRSNDRPYFLFVNLADPHQPYVRQGENRFMPAGVSDARVDDVLSRRPHFAQICRRLPDAESLGILGALYLGQVEAADRKLGAIVDLTRAHSRGAGAPTPKAIVTADHGALFGEQRLLGHAFSVDNRVIRVPLVLAGEGEGEGEAGRVVEGPVAQPRLASTLRCWAGDTQQCTQGLPRESGAEPASPVVSILGNEIVKRPPAAVFDTDSLLGRSNHANALCPPEAGARGRSVAYFQGPLKYVWRERAAPRLFDVSWDPNERTNQLDRPSAAAVELAREVESFVARRRLDRVHRFAPDESEPLPVRAARAYEAGLRTVLATEKTATDAVWFAQICDAVRPDPELREWIQSQIPLHEDDPFLPIIAPDRTAPTPVEADPGHGMVKFQNYLRASVSGPDEIAMPQFEEYVLMDADGYVLTHQLSGIEWARAMGRPLTPATLARRSGILERIAREHASDPYFSDLWVERAAFLAAFSSPRPDELEAWAERVVLHHLGDGDWGQGGTDIAFDGQSLLGNHPRAHVRGLAMIVLAHYLAGVPGG